MERRREKEGRKQGKEGGERKEQNKKKTPALISKADSCHSGKGNRLDTSPEEVRWNGRLLGTPATLSTSRCGVQIHGCPKAIKFRTNEE